MSGDYSRLTFDPGLDFSSVLLQQGRPLTDADWDEAEALTWRRIQAGAWDTFSQSVVPQTTPSGFEITLSAGELAIGRGRIYVDGLLAENHGAGDPAWDVRLAESFGEDPLAFKDQPYAPGAPSPPESGKHVAFVDVWLREVTQFERPELVEPAIGVDTTARLQTAWQVRLLGLPGATGGIVCATPDDKLPGWAALIAPSAGRLSIGTGAAAQPNPCLIPPSGGYKGLENQLYRIEIHTGGAQDAATFKWSRDNASVAARVLRVVGTDTVIVDSVGKDSVLRFNPGDWIEIIDDVLELGVDPASHRPRHVGQMYRIADGGVDDATRALTLEPSTLGLAAFPADAQGVLDAGRHTRVRRWDHKGTVRRADGSVWFELDTSDGEIPLPPAGTQLQLESGILVSFDLDGTIANGEFHSGDWWVCAARAGDAASIETLDKAPPRGVHHHYARLAIVTFPAGVQDCRVLWPLPTTSGGGGEGGGGEACCCTVCVSPEQHAQGLLTLQKAIDTVKSTGGTVCLLPGTYTLKAPLHIDGAHGVTVAGQGAATMLEAPAGAFVVQQSTDVWLHDLAITGPPEAGSAGFAAIAAANVLGFTVERLEIGMGEKVTNGVGILLAGVVGEATLRENRINAPLGIVFSGQTAAPTGLMLLESATSVSASANLVIDDNLLQCALSGIRFDEKSVTQLLTRLRGNRVLGCHAEAVLLAGLVAPGAAIEIAGNHLTVLGDGIVCGPGDYRIVDNDLVCAGDAEPHEALSVRPGQDSKLQGDYHIVGNHAVGFLTAGIAVSASARTVLVKQNRTERCGCGVRVEAESFAQRVIVDNNVIVDLAPGTPPASTVSLKAGVRGIAIRHAGVVHVCGNVLNGVDPATKELQFYSGIQVVQCERATVTGNDILGPPAEVSPLASGILVHDVTGPLQVAHNTVRRLVTAVGASPQDASLWMPLGVASKGDDPTGGGLAPTGGLASSLTTAVGTLAFAASAGAADEPPVARPLVAVIGNELEGGGRSAVARVSGAIDCQFTSNHCVHLSPEAQSKGVGDVQLAAITVIAAQNRVFGGEESFDIHLVSTAGLTMLGNISRGKIVVNGAGLPPPWQPFNVEGV